MVNPFKKHSAEDNAGELLGFACSVRGYAHLRGDRPCQDSSLFERHDGWCLAVVCDGHGGDDYVRSADGSRLCTEAVSACVSDPALIPALRAAAAASDESLVEKMLLQLEKSIICEWNRLVAEDAAARPFSAAELGQVSPELSEAYLHGELIEVAYGTTLIAGIVCGGMWFCLQIGDGRCVVIDESGEYTQPVPADALCHGNITTSICQEDALAAMRHCFGFSQPYALLLGTDGVDGSFEDDDALYDFYSIILNSAAENGIGSAYEELVDFLPRLSQKGVGDDISIAAIIDPRYLLSDSGQE